jgi:hypothetical protein
VTYRLNVTIDVDGRQHASEVTRRNSFSKRWIREMNQAGCQQTHGTALAFRLIDNRVLLLGTDICDRAKQELSDNNNKYQYEQIFTQAMSTGRTVDVRRFCFDMVPDIDTPERHQMLHGFVVDNADRPTRWIGFRYGEKLKNSDTTIRLVSAKATASQGSPADKLDEVAPGVVRTYFEYKQWSESPERILDFNRRVPQLYKANPE